MAKTHQRVFALVAALLFFGTSVGVSAVVVWQVREQNKAEKAAQATQDQTSEAIKKLQEQNQPQEGKLQGTKLADFSPTAKIDSLQKTDLVTGSGAEVKAGDTITAHYTGAVAADGTIFQSSHDGGQPATFPLSGVIQGWQEGVPGMKVGGKRRLLIPASMAYGANPPQGSGIPANADLVFDIELVSIGQ